MIIATFVTFANVERENTLEVEVNLMDIK